MAKTSIIKKARGLLPAAGSARAKPAPVTLAQRRKQLADVQKSLAKLVKDVEQLADKYAGETVKPAARAVKKTAAKAVRPAKKSAPRARTSSTGPVRKAARRARKITK